MSNLRLNWGALIFFFFSLENFISPPQGETLQRALVFMQDVRQVLGCMDKPGVDFLKYIDKDKKKYWRRACACWRYLWKKINTRGYFSSFAKLSRCQQHWRGPRTQTHMTSRRPKRTAVESRRYFSTFSTMNRCYVLFCFFANWINRQSKSTPCSSRIRPCWSSVLRLSASQLKFCRLSSEASLENAVLQLNIK